MTGEAPSASRTLAVSFITTKLVMLWMSGVRSRMLASDCAVSSARSRSDIGHPPEVVHRPVASAERLRVFYRSLQEGACFPRRFQRRHPSSQAGSDGRRESAARAVRMRRLDSPARQDLEGPAVE